MQFYLDEPHSSTIKDECETMLTNLHYSIPPLDKSFKDLPVHSQTVSPEFITYS